MVAHSSGDRGYTRAIACCGLAAFLFLLPASVHSGCGAAESTAAESPRVDLALRILLAPEARVRFDAPSLLSSRFVGTVVALRSDTLEVAGHVGTPAAKPVAWTGLVPLSAIGNLERSPGSKGHALVGMGIGFVLGAVIGMATYDRSSADEDEFDWSTIRGVLFGLVGVIPGGMIGAQFRTEQWEKVRVEPLLDR